jgi:predicted acetyltransferase
LSPALAASYGHIGYGVRPGERRKGYATAMLRHALEVCRTKGLSEVILGCYKDNIASVRTILKCGGVLTAENNNYSEGRISQYYTICL